MLNLPWNNCLSSTFGLKSTFSLLRSCKSPSSSPPLSNPLLLPFVSATYLITLLLLSRISHHPFFQSPLFTHASILHNSLLSLLSLIMNLGAIHAVTTVSHFHNFRTTLCTPNSHPIPPQIELWIYLFYLSKFYELLDTVILVLRRRPLSMLHVWHHTSVMYEIYAWLQFGVTIAIYGMIFNTAVHVVMYAYYAFALLKVRFPFKRAITITQIVQFLVGFGSLIPFARLHFAGHGCRGVPGLFFSALLNATYLAMFIKFYGNAYRKKLQ